MPELPEVETICRALRPSLVGRRFVRVRIFDPRLTAPEPPSRVARAMTGEVCEAVTRRGKYVVVGFSSGRHLLVHLRMTGTFQLAAGGSLEDDPYRRAVVRLDDGSDVAYRDVRRFGTWRLLPSAEAGAFLEARLGPEPLEDDFDATALGRALDGRRAPLKSAILDQRTVAGLGNIYADEALWRAGLHPRRPAGSLAAVEHRSLHAAIRDALTAGIERQGATLRDYRDPAGRAGSMQEEFNVYGRKAAPCPRCAAPIVRIVVSGRGSWLCPDCQRLEA